MMYIVNVHHILTKKNRLTVYSLTRRDRIRNEYIRETAQVQLFGDKERGKAETVWTCAEEG